MRLPIRHSALAIVIAPLALAACDRDRPEAPPLADAAPVATPATPVDAGPMTRGELLAVGSGAAAAFAAGEVFDDSALIGRRFSAVIPFGCFGPAPLAEEAPADGLARWAWGEDRQTIRLTFHPGDWSGAPPMRSAEAAATIEAAAGAWIPRAWSASETCPTGGRAPPTAPPTEAAVVEAAAEEGERAVVPTSGGAATPARPAAAPPPPSPQTFGLVQLYPADSARSGRAAGRDFAHVVRGQGDAPPAAPASGYRLVLEGRIDRFPSGRAVHCRAATPDVRPVCVMAVSLDRVAYRDGQGAQLAEWRLGAAQASPGG